MLVRSNRNISSTNMLISSLYEQAKWLPTLRTLVDKINEAFGHNFREMAVAGEVSLGKFLL